MGEKSIQLLVIFSLFMILLLWRNKNTQSQVNFLGSYEKKRVYTPPYEGKVFPITNDTILCLKTTFIKEKTEEYLGCYADSTTSRVFANSPIDYIPTDLSPTSCMVACGFNYRYAAIQNGTICLCSDTIPPVTLSEDKCAVQCTTDKQASEGVYPRCGGMNALSVYNLSSRIFKVDLDIPKEVEIYQNTEIKTITKNGRNIEYFYDTGDMYNLPSLSSRDDFLKHTYYEPGTFKVSVQASNNISGIYSAETLIDVTEDISGGKITCNDAQVYGKFVECYGEIKKGSPKTIEIAFGDGSSEDVTPSIVYSHTGSTRNLTEKYDKIEGSSFTYILPKEEFHEDSTLYAWQVKAAKTGDVYLQVFRPTCDEGEKYCYDRHACFPSEQTCNDIDRWSCEEGAIYCIFSQKCIVTDELYNQCPLEKPYNFLSAPANYILIEQTKYHIETLGEQIMELEQPVSVKKGDIVGWTSGGGAIGFREIYMNDIEAPEFLYSPSTDIKTLFEDEDATLEYYEHFISAHYVRSGRFFLQHKYASPGTYIISSDFYSRTVNIDYTIKNFRLDCPNLVKSNESFVITKNHSWVKYVTYNINFGNGTLVQRDQFATSYTYHYPGVYVINVTAINSVSFQSEICVVKVLDEIKNLRFDAEIGPVAVTQKTEIKWCIDKGTNVTYSIDFGDGQNEIKSRSSSSNCYSLMHTYQKEGEYIVRIEAKNSLDKKLEIEGMALVEIPIDSIEFLTTHSHLTENVYLDVHEPIFYEVRTFKGTNIKCSFDFGDKNELSDTNIFVVSHSYSQPGTYHVSANCFNAISSASDVLNATVIVKRLEKITGLAIEVNCTLFGEKAKIKGSMKTGSLFICTWDLGDGAKLSKDKSNFDEVIVHQYMAVSDYKIELSCKNPLGVVKTEFVVPVEIPINGLGLQCPNKYLEVDKEATFRIVAAQGSRLSFEINFGDGERQIKEANEVVNNSLVISHKYMQPGFYQANVTSWNRLDRRDSHCKYLLKVLNPIQNIVISSNSPVRLNSGLVDFQLNILDDADLPIEANITWDFGDDEVFYNNSLIIEKRETFLRSYRFKEEGQFNVIALFENEISEKVVEHIVYVQKIHPIKIIILANPPLKIDTANSNDLLSFSLDQEIQVNFTKQYRDKYYEVKLNNDLETRRIRLNHLKYLYKKPGIKEITVTVINELGIFNAQKTIKIQESIKNMKLKLPLEIQVNETYQYNISADKYGTQTCAIIDFGDGNVNVKNQQFCSSLIENPEKTYHYIGGVENGLITFSKAYNRKGLYKIEVQVYNLVSNFHSIEDVEVIYQPCPMPIPAISDKRNKNEPIKSFKSSKIIIQSNVTVECYVATVVVFHWKLFSEVNQKVINLGDGFGYRKSAMPFSRNPGGLDPTVLEIPENMLPYGLVRVEMHISYEINGVFVEGITGRDETFYEIMPSRLKAKINGGVRRAVGKDLQVEFDASQSFDPDAGEWEGELHYKWYCRRKNEEFHERFELIPPKAQDAGCFRNGRFFLSEGYGGFQVVNEDQSIITINTNFPLYQEFVMRVYVTKEHRYSIEDQEFIIWPGDPPTLQIQCTLNCFEKLYPTDSLRIQSVCLNCAMKSLLYEWKLYERQEIIEDNIKKIKEIEDTDLPHKVTTAVNDANIALKENVLEFGKNYVLRVAAWQEGASEEHRGFSDFVFTVNIPPRGGFCNINPREGVTIQTTFFIRCGNWEDEDTPLTYRVDVIRNGIKQNIYSGPEREIETILPVGDQKSNFEYVVRVIVEDKYAFGVTSDFKVTVKEPKNIDFDQVADDIDGVADKGNLQELSSLALAVGSVMNKHNGENTTKNSNNREKMIASISKVKACTLNTIKQMGAVQMELTKATDEVSDEAQKTSGDALDFMSECMVKVNSEDPNMADASTTMFMATSNVFEANVASQKNMSNATENAGKANPDGTIDTINKVGGSLMRQMVAGDKPKVFKTASMEMEMSQIPDDMDDETAGFKLPVIKSLFGNQSEEIENTGRKASVGAMVTSMKNNPYKGSSGSNDVKSNVMGLALSGPDGKPMDLTGQELTMFVKRDTKNDVQPIQYNYDVEYGSMKVHRFNLTDPTKYIVIEVRPVDAHTLSSVHISHEKRTTISNSVANYTQISLNEAKSVKKLPDPYIKIFTADELNGTGEYYIGIKLSPARRVIYNRYGYDPIMNYTLRTWETICKIWDADAKVFSDTGCQVGPKTTFNKTHCICQIGSKEDLVIDRVARSTESQKAVVPRKRTVVKRATFAGGFFVAPNPIDFSKAFAGFTNLSENPVCFSVVLSIFGVYLILLFWARREDRKDIERAGVTALKENDPFDRQFYEITVFTGFGSSAGTTANVYFQLSGDENQTEVRQLKDENRKVFQKRGEDIFLASFQESIGDLQYVRIWHDNTGKSPSWCLSRILIHDLNQDRKYLFINDNILAVEEGDGSLERVLPVAGPDEIKSFNHLFFSTSQKNLTDSHIWFSVFIRPPKSRFTRVQRLSCCLTLLYCTMVTNAMFYQVGGEADPSTTLHVGPFAFSPSQIGIGIMTSLIIFPVNILIVGVFRGIGPKPTPEEMAKKKTKRFWWFREFFFCCPEKKNEEFIDIIQNSDGRASRNTIMSNASTLDGEDIAFKMETAEQEKQREERRLKMKKKKKKLPYWMKYFAWCLLILTSFTSAFFVVLYGFQFGKEKSAQWISALTISFFQDVCVSQPMKILGLALFIALIVKKPAEEEDDQNGNSNKKQIDEEYLNKEDASDSKETKKPQKSDIIRFQPPSKQKIAALRIYRLKELKMYSLLRDIFLYLLFVVALCQVTYSHMDPKSIYVRKTMEDTFVYASYGGDKAYYDISSLDDVWTWLNTTVVKGMYATHYYNDEPIDPGFTQDMYSNLFGGSRLRQLRIKDHSCEVHKDFVALIPNCHTWYSWGNEDTAKYDPGWKPYSNHTGKTRDIKYYDSWQYKTRQELDTYPFVGGIAAYGGGGFIANMGRSPLESLEIINALEKHQWLDDQTRALFLEATIYNAQVNLFAIMNFVVEVLPTNGIELYHSIKIAKLYTFGGSAESFTIACQFFVVTFFLIFIYREGKKIYHERKKYFRGFWNFTEFATIILILATVSVFFSRMLLVNGAIKKIEENPGQFVSFNKVVQWDVLFSALTSILVLLSCVKSIRLLQYNKTISLLASTLKGSAKPLAAFFIVFFVFFVAFTSFAYLLYMPHLTDYKSFITASESVLSLLLGTFDFSEISSTNRILGPIWFFLIMMFGVMYLVNVFLSIIMETYASVKDDLSRQSQEYELVDFMVQKFMHVIGKGSDGQKLAVAKIEETERNQQLQEEIKKQNKENKLKKQSSTKQNPKYYQKLDEEIESKFAQLDNSLNGYWQHGFQNEKENYSYVNPSFEYQEMYEELEVQKELQAELQKWS